MSPSPNQDTRAAQIERVARYLERNPGATLRQISVACDTGSATKVISVMRKPESGFVIKRELRPVRCNKGRNARNVAHYWLISRPAWAQGDLFKCP
jgi:hypothetical protein